MARIPPEDIWGVGPANARKLGALGCESAADVRNLDTRAVRKAMTVVGERLVRELRGEACLDLEKVAATRKGCAVTRSFSDRVEDRATMEQAAAAHATRLGEKLRREGLGTDHVTVFFHTSEHDRTRPQRSDAHNDTALPWQTAASSPTCASALIGRVARVRGRAGTVVDTAKARAARGRNADKQAEALAPILARIDRNGTASLRAVAAALTDENIPTPSGRGAWTPTAVARLRARLAPAS